jgi:hypothetical protein
MSPSEYYYHLHQQLLYMLCIAFLSPIAAAIIINSSHR